MTKFFVLQHTLTKRFLLCLMVDENILKQQQKEFGMTVVFILFQQLKKQKHSLFQFSL